MATTTELKEEYTILKQQLDDINTRITALLQRNNKKYTYSNQETTHSAETHSLKELQDLRKDIRDQMNSIEYQIGGVFVQFKNC